MLLGQDAHSGHDAHGRLASACSTNFGNRFYTKHVNYTYVNTITK